MRNKKAFTIIELIVVVAILGVLVLLAGPKLLGYVEKAELTRIQHDVKVMEHEMKLAIIDKEVEIAKWGNNKKNLGALIMQDKLFEKEGAAERIDARHLTKNGILVSNNNENAEFAKITSDEDLGVGGDMYLMSGEDLEFTSVDETYKIIPTEYKGVIGTKLSGIFYTNDLGKVYYEHDKPIKGGKEKEKTLDCPLPLSDYEFDPETGTIVKWYGTETHLIIPEAFRAEVNGEEQCVPVKIIGEAAFMQGGFRSIVIPQSVIRIEENAFKDNQLTTINIPHSVIYIGSEAFVGNSFGSGGSNIIIRNICGNVEIVPGAFGGYEPTYRSIRPKDLNMVFHPSSGTIISAGPSKSRVITIPETLSVGGIEYPVKQIDKGAYQGLGLISVVLPSGLERIEDYAFAGNQLIGITIPSKVNHIGHYAFAFNEVEHTITGHRKATIEFINIKNEELFHKVNQYGDIYENGTKVKNYKGQDGSEARLLNHIFVTSIENHVVDEKYVGANPGELEDNNEDSEVVAPGPQPDKDGSVDTSVTTDGIYTFHGEVKAENFINGNELASEIRLTAGTAQHSEEPWLKFTRKEVDGNVTTMFVAKKPLRHTVSWEGINSVGAVFGTRTVEIDGQTYKVRLMKGALTNPSEDKAADRGAHGSEWNRMMLPIHEQAIDQTWRYPKLVENNIKPFVHTLGSGKDGMYTDDDLLTNNRSGSRTWTQENIGSDSSLNGLRLRVVRGGGGVSSSGENPRGPIWQYFGWRPVLELVPAS